MDKSFMGAYCWDDRILQISSRSLCATVFEIQYDIVPFYELNTNRYRHGYRSGTRYAFQRDFKKHGTIALSTYLKVYKVGDIVDIKANGAIQKGMPHKYYHGKTGIVFNVTKSSVGVIVNKVVGNRYIEKRLSLRIEHVKHSACRQEFLNRVKTNAALKRAAKEKGEQVYLKRQPAKPRGERIVSTKGNVPQTLAPVPYETFI